MNTNRLVLGPLHSVAAAVARSIERASIDPKYQFSELTAHKCAFAEQGASFDRMFEAERADIEVMRVCGHFPGAALCLARIEAGRGSC